MGKRISILIIGFLLAICIFSNNNIFAANTLEPQKIEDEQLFTLIYETEEYKSGNYYLLIGRNDLGYYKILFLKKTDTLKVYINNFNGNDYRVYYSEPVSQIWYNADKNPTSLSLQNKNFIENDNKFYKSNSREFYSDFNIYSDNTYTSLFYEVDSSFSFCLNTKMFVPFINMINNNLSVLLTFGLLIMGIIIVLFLIPKIIYKFF